MEKEIHGYKYRCYKNMMWGQIVVEEPCRLFVENCEVEIINMTDSLLHVAYRKSTITAKVEKNNRYILDVYQKTGTQEIAVSRKRLANGEYEEKKKARVEYVHIFISPYNSDVPTHVPEIPFSVVGGKGY